MIVEDTKDLVETADYESATSCQSNVLLICTFIIAQQFGKYNYKFKKCSFFRTKRQKGVKKWTVGLRKQSAQCTSTK